MITELKADISFWTGFYNDEDCLSWASDKAYLDMNRTMTFKDNPKNNNDKKRVDEERKNWRNEGTEIIRKNINAATGDFCEWHKTVCGALIEFYAEDKLVLRENNKDVHKREKKAKLTYGQAQKWLNMTLKYLWLLNRLDLINDEKIRNFVSLNEKSFHVPLDSYILRYVAKQSRNKKETFGIDNELNNYEDFSCFWENFGSAWSQINDQEGYYEYQAKLATAIDGKYPLEWELVHWHKAINYYDDKKKQYDELRK